MRLIWYVALGGAGGSVARYLLGTFVQQRTGDGFPWGTLGVNVTGSFLLGFLLRTALATPAFSPELRALLMVGFCGGYTTFSAYSYETAALIEGGAYSRAVVYAVASVVVSLGATFVGMMAAREFLDLRTQL